MADHKDYKMIAEELRRQGWTVDQTTRGHYKAVPPDPKHQMVHFSHSDDHHALLNIIRDLKKRGFIWPAPSKKELAVERRLEAESRPSEPEIIPDTPSGVHVTPPAESPEVRMDRLFHELKDAKVLAALTEEQFQECQRRVEEATRALAEADRERTNAIEALKKKKTEFDSAFEAAA